MGKKALAVARDSLSIAICYNNPYGGAGRAVYETAVRLAAHHRVTLFTPTPEGRGLPELDRLHPVRPRLVAGFPPIPRPFGRFSPLTDLVEMSLLNRAYQSIADRVNGAFDLAFVHSCPHTSAPLLLRQLRIPSAWYTGEPLRHLHEPRVQRPYGGGRLLGTGSDWLDHHDPLAALRNRVLRKLERQCACSASVVLTYSYFSREVLWRTYGVDAKVVYLGIDTDVYRPLPVVPEYMVLSVGHVSPLKGHDFVIESVATIPEAARPAVVIAGDTSLSPERRYLEDLALRKSVKLVFERSTSQEEVVMRYCRARVVAFAPVMEPFGLVPLEAMACGVPVVGVREGGLRETIAENQGGYLVDRDPNAFGERLLTLLVDDGLRTDQGKMGRNYVIEHWGWERSMYQLKRAFSELLAWERYR